MSDLSLSIYARAGLIGSVPAPMNPELKLSVRDYQHTISAIGGFDTASITIDLTRDEAEEWYANGVGRHIEALGGSLIPAWEGFVNSIELRAGSLTAKRGPLMGVTNRLTAEYQKISWNTNPPVGGQKVVMPEVDNTESQDKHGTFMGRVSLGSADDNQAEVARDDWLRDSAYPKRDLTLTIPGGSDTYSISLECLGYSHLLTKSYYEQVATSTLTNASSLVAVVLNANPNGLFGSQLLTTNTLQVETYHEGDQTSWSIVTDVVSLGDANNNRYLFGVYEDRLAIYAPAPTTPSYSMLLYEPEQSIRDYGSKSVVKPWEVLPGRWIEISDLVFAGFIYSASLADNERMVFAEKVTYTAPWSISIDGGLVNTIDQRLAKFSLGSKYGT